jgi:protease I
MRALIISDDLFEDSELSEPLRLLQAKGVRVDVAAPRKGLITGKHGCTVVAGLGLAEVEPGNYGLLVLPGGKAPARLQHNPLALAIAREFLQAGKPVAAICHGARLLIPDGLLAGRIASCYRDMVQELQAAGAEYRDSEVVVDGNLITSRQPADLPVFMQAVFRSLQLD